MVETESKERRQRKFLGRILKPTFLIEWVEIWKEKGFKGFVKEKGWKVVVAFFLFYLIRDSLLYLVLPYLAAKGLLGC